jgi:hypothetical protein
MPGSVERGTAACGGDAAPIPGSVERGIAAGGGDAAAFPGVTTPFVISPATAAAGPPDGETSVVRAAEGDDVGNGITTAGSSERDSDDADGAFSPSA